MRILGVLLIGLLASCKGNAPKERPAATPPSPTPAPPSPTPAPPVVDAAEAAAPLTPVVPTAPEEPLDPKKPVEVTRHHVAGQHYTIAMTHTGFVKEEYAAEATVKTATEDKITFDVTIKSLRIDDKPRVENATLSIVVDLVDRTVDAEPTGGPDVTMYLTPIEIMLGDGGWPPAGKHKRGDKWKDRFGQNWTLAGIDMKDKTNFVHYTTKQTYKDNAGEQSSDLELAARDGYTGHVTLKQSLNIAGKTDTQVYDLTVTSP